MTCVPASLTTFSRARTCSATRLPTPARRLLHRQLAPRWSARRTPYARPYGTFTPIYSVTSSRECGPAKLPHHAGAGIDKPAGSIARSASAPGRNAHGSQQQDGMPSAGVMGWRRWTRRSRRPWRRASSGRRDPGADGAMGGGIERASLQPDPLLQCRKPVEPFQPRRLPGRHHQPILSSKPPRSIPVSAAAARPVSSCGQQPANPNGAPVYVLTGTIRG